MINLLLIIFNYNQNIGYKDFLIIYNWSLTLNSNIIIISDFKIKQTKNILFHYEVTNDKQFLNIIDKIKFDDSFIFYYSGHGKLDGIVLPNENIFLFDDLKNKLININNHVVSPNIFVILDCCYPTSFKLPFYWNNDNFQFDKNGKFTKTKIILINCSNNNGKSFWTINGSIFSKILFSTLRGIIKNNKNLSFKFIIKKINNKLKNYNNFINLYSSHFINPYLPNWIYSKYYKSIYYTNTFENLIIKKL